MMRAGDKAQSYAVTCRGAWRCCGIDRWSLLVIVGDGPERTAILDRFSQQISTRRRRSCSMSAGLADAYARADLLVWPAVNEAFGMVLLEAQAAGLPVVAGAERGVPEIVADGETGLLTAPRDPDALAAAIATLLDDAPRRAAMAEACAGHTTARHDLPVAAKALDKVLKELVP